MPHEVVKDVKAQKQKINHSQPPTFSDFAFSAAFNVLSFGVKEWNDPTTALYDAVIYFVKLTLFIASIVVLLWLFFRIYCQ